MSLAIQSRVTVRVAYTLLGNVEPNGVPIKCVLIRVEAAERRIAFNTRTSPTGVHGGIMLVTKGDTSTGLAFAVAFSTLPAYRFMLIALELPLTASQAKCKSALCKVSKESSVLPSGPRPHDTNALGLTSCKWMLI